MPSVFAPHTLILSSDSPLENFFSSISSLSVLTVKAVLAIEVLCRSKLPCLLYQGCRWSCQF